MKQVSHPKPRGLVRRSLVPLGLALYVFLVLAEFWHEPAAYRWVHGALTAGLFALVLSLFLAARRKFSAAGNLPLAAGFSLLVLLASLIQATGGPDHSPLSPAVFLLLALLASVQPISHALSNAGLCALFAAGRFVQAGMPRARLELLLSEAIFFVFFSFGVGALLGWERSRRRRLESVVRHLQSDRDELRQGSVLELPNGREEINGEKSDSSISGPPQLHRAIEDDLESLARYLERSLYALVGRLAKIVSCRTCALYLLDRSGQEMRLREAVSGIELEVDTRVGPGQGLVGWVLENGAPVVMNNFDPLRYRLPYYGKGQDVGSFLAVPVPAEGIESSSDEKLEAATGVLCADAPVEDAFPPEALQIFRLAASQVTEILTNARTLRRVHEEKREFEGLYAFSTLLSGSLRAEEIAPALLSSADKILSYDFGAVVIQPHAGEGDAQVRAARGEGAERVEGKAVPHEESRAGWVIKTGQSLPLTQRASGGRPLLFPKEKLPNFESAVLLPFHSNSSEGVLGCLALASKEKKRLGLFEARLLELLARQATSALLNARLYERMEALATTDGLTGLCNHRTFQERLDLELKRAERSGHPLCLVLTDIDHFKKFNDTYGHPVGDAVLRHLARIYTEGIRDIDLVARYGGEEFVFIFPETDLRTARDVCQRLRRTVERSRVREGDLELRVTISMGIAEFPTHASQKSALIECADTALYRAKDEGRNRLCTWDASLDGDDDTGEDSDEVPTLTAVHTR